ncbi:hypothetical protein FE810_08385 [Thalassotalea litorea]|uniref:Uncharacterized protein n=1 Tax=Thalassotalea litorea TaxID=2020715 RepID=A0A5R9IL35_9GAMM|nr:hypothetical protein [Thalassotalea litorea]TLU65299.1 hypothetical protein FE810_08385 [Thalassotalea litorea]
MARILKELFLYTADESHQTNHAADKDGYAICSENIHLDDEFVYLATGAITCSECAEIIRVCKGIQNSEILDTVNEHSFARIHIH